MTDLDEESIDTDALFFAVLTGVIANGNHETWQSIYSAAKVGAQTIYALIVEDTIADELVEAQKDLHGR